MGADEVIERASGDADHLASFNDTHPIVRVLDDLKCLVGADS